VKNHKNLSWIGRAGEALKECLLPSWRRRSREVREKVGMLESLRKTFSDPSREKQTRLMAIEKYQSVVEGIHPGIKMSQRSAEKLKQESHDLGLGFMDNLVTLPLSAAVALHKIIVVFRQLVDPEDPNEPGPRIYSEVLRSEEPPPAPENTDPEGEILLGDVETIRRLGVHYVCEEESIGGNAGPNHAAYNMHVHPGTGAIRAVGNPQNVPDGLVQDLQEITLRVQVFPDDPSSPEQLKEFRSYVHEIYVRGRQPISSRLREVLGDMLGKKFSSSREENYPFP
jgi:hypothetical protein